MSTLRLDLEDTRERPDGSVPAPAPRSRALRWLLGIPLISKLLGANLIVAIAAVVVAAVWGHPVVFALVCLALAISFALSTLLVRLALRPLDDLRDVAERVSNGDFTARVPQSPLADASMRQLGETVNRLLDHVNADRQRIRQLIRQSLRVREAERASIAEELREATAQQLSGLSLQLAAAARDNTDPVVAASLHEAREIASRMVEDVRSVAESVYPGLLGAFGLPAGLQALGRRVAARTTLDVSVDVDGFSEALSPGLVTALYRVADEAVRNVERHSLAGSVWITLSSERADGRSPARVRLEVEDDGTGFDVEAAERHSLGIGLFRARELLAHAGGELLITSAPGRGTSVVAIASVEAESEDLQS